MGEGGCGDQAGPGKKQVDNLSPPTFCLLFTIYFRELYGRREEWSNGQQVLKPQPARSPGGCGWDVNHHGMQNWSVLRVWGIRGIWASDKGGACSPAHGTAAEGPEPGLALL